MIIGLTGKKRSGKDTVANILVRDYGFTRVAFADKMKEVLEFYNPTLMSRTGLYSDLNNLLRIYGGWENLKSSAFGESLRTTMQRMGMGVREVLGADTWVDAVDLQAHKRIVVSDVRLANEAEHITSKGGIHWRITRPSTDTDADQHITEQALDLPKTSLEIANIGDIQHLESEVHIAYEASVYSGGHCEAPG